MNLYREVTLEELDKELNEELELIDNRGLVLKSLEMDNMSGLRKALVRQFGRGTGHKAKRLKVLYQSRLDIINGKKIYTDLWKE
ncbi:hypothetical protein SP15_182 [Bacillus phage SP-15]|uniref:Uncharacterized protein n=1 Tax=Bacillus phage SP-15 TaxID=1792032 RepID=A0A127AWJ7_9CAUD|nr:hypothetical protein SP15_182 [Bacillus phage SP-15]AMM44980.1 hypothetical protein SP15_182 [Bacillus phage SP-15]